MLTRSSAPAALAALALVACSAEPEPPRLAVAAVSPNVATDAAPVEVAITGEFHVRATTDFDDPAKSAVDATYAARIGDVPLAAVTLGADRTLHATLPAGVAAGTYDVAVTDPWGRTATLSAAFRVNHVAHAAGLGFATIGGLKAAACAGPFLVERRGDDGKPVAEDSAVAVKLSSDEPRALGTYSDSACGVPVADLTIAPGTRTAAFYLRADAAGAFGLAAASATLGAARVTVTATRDASTEGLALVAPKVLLRSRCAPFAVEKRDAQGALSTASAGVDVQLSVRSGAARFYGDAGCLGALSRVTIAAGTSSVSAYLLSTDLGAAELAAFTPGLLPAFATVDVRATATPTALAFTGAVPSVQAGACSAALTLEARDADGNPGDVAANEPITLAPLPGAIGYFSDATCQAALGAFAMAAGTRTARFYVSATLAGSLSLSATGATLAKATTTLPITAAAADHFEVTAPATVAEDAAFTLTARAKDRYGNDVTSYARAAAVSVGAGLLGCVTNCRVRAGTAAFVDGAYSGTWVLGPAGAARTVQFVEGAVGGTSGAIAVTADAAAHTPPLARLEPGARVVAVGGSVTLDASGSRGTGLEASFDATGQTAGSPPWAPFGSALTATATFGTAGRYTPRVAVRDASQAVAYAQADVLAVPAADLCLVTATDLTDDGATGCAGGFGTDGKLSLAEAVRLANAAAGRQAIALAPNTVVTGATELTFSDAVDLAGAPGARLDGPRLAFAADATVLGLALSGGTKVTVEAAAAVGFVEVEADGFAGVVAKGTFSATGSTFRRCAASCVSLEPGASTAATLVRTRFFDTAGSAVRCNAARPVDVRSGLFVRNDLAIAGACGKVTVVHATFHQNGAALSMTGAGHEVKGSLFTRQVSAACVSASLAVNTHNLAFGNAADGCVAGGTDPLGSDPAYVSPSADDLRLRLVSPAKDSGADLGLDLNGAAPGDFLGSQPDRGGMETW